MNRPETGEDTPEAAESLEDVLRRHNREQIDNGIYHSWIELVAQYCIDESSTEQEALNAFARSEFPLVATVSRNTDIRYPGLHAYFLVKMNPKSRQRVSYGVFGLEPIIVALVDNEGNIVDETDKYSRPDVYTDEQVRIVVQQAHELEEFGINQETMKAPGWPKWPPR